MFTGRVGEAGRAGCVERRGAYGRIAASVASHSSVSNSSISLVSSMPGSGGGSIVTVGSGSDTRATMVVDVMDGVKLCRLMDEKDGTLLS